MYVVFSVPQTKRCAPRQKAGPWRISSDAHKIKRWAQTGKVTLWHCWVKLTEFNDIPDAPAVLVQAQWPSKVEILSSLVSCSASLYTHAPEFQPARRQIEVFYSVFLWRPEAGAFNPCCVFIVPWVKGGQPALCSSLLRYERSTCAVFHCT